MEERVYNPQFFDKEFLKNKSGIYQIRNKINNKIYISSTKNLERRCRLHFNALNRGDHENKYLQRAYNKQGKDDFIFEIIEFCEPQVQFEIEQYWINKYIGNAICYNLNEKASCPPTRTKEQGNSPVFTKEQRDHLSRLQRKRYEEHPELKEEASKRRKGKYVGKDNPFSKSVICIETGKIFYSMTDAAKYIDCRGQDISNCCRKNQLTVKGFHWLYKEEYDKLNSMDLQNILNRKYKHFSRKCMCIETQKIYNSGKEAAQDLNCCISSISVACNNPTKSIKGYHFKFIEGDINA